MSDEEEHEEYTLSEAFEFARESAVRENDNFEGDPAPHAGRLIASRATDLGDTITSIEMYEADERTDGDVLDDGHIQTALAEDIVDILMTVGALQFEYGDLPVEERFAARVQLIEDYEALKDAMENAEDQEAKMEAMDEHMTEELAEFLGTPESPATIGDPPEPGTDVSDDDFEGDPDRHVH